MSLYVCMCLCACEFLHLDLNYLHR